MRRSFVYLDCLCTNPKNLLKSKKISSIRGAGTGIMQNIVYQFLRTKYDVKNEKIMVLISSSSSASDFYKNRGLLPSNEDGVWKLSVCNLFRLFKRY